MRTDDIEARIMPWDVVREAFRRVWTYRSLYFPLVAYAMLVETAYWWGRFVPYDGFSSGGLSAVCLSIVVGHPYVVFTVFSRTFHTGSPETAGDPIVFRNRFSFFFPAIAALGILTVVFMTVSSFLPSLREARVEHLLDPLSLGYIVSSWIAYCLVMSRYGFILPPTVLGQNYDYERAQMLRTGYVGRITLTVLPYAVVQTFVKLSTPIDGYGERIAQWWNIPLYMLSGVAFFFVLVIYAVWYEKIIAAEEAEKTIIASLQD